MEYRYPPSRFFLIPGLVLVLIAIYLTIPTNHMPKAQADGTHPFLIVSESEYSELQDRAHAEPWSTWKTQAMDTAANGVIDSSTVRTKSESLSIITSSAALSYIVDTANQSAYKQKIIDMIDYYDASIYGYLDSGDWNELVPPSSALFYLVLALDIIHDDLTPTQLASAETKLNKAADWYYAHKTGSWEEARIGAYGIWAIYEHDTARMNKAKTDYKNRLLSMFTPDGVFFGGSGYATARLSQDWRATKTHFMDVLEYTGEESFYDDPSFVEYFEWMYGYTVTPVIRNQGGKLVKETYTFGDTTPNHASLTAESSAAFYRAYKFGAVAGQNAAWSVAGTTLSTGHLMNYVLMDQSLPTGATVNSRIFKDGGAWLVESGTSANLLAGALWNPKSSEYHTHKDVNALHLTAYGEHVLRNTGYCGAGNACAGFNFDYINKRAVGNNTVLIDYNNFTNDYLPPSVNDHANKSGNGIVEGFTGGKLEYASGDSGSALPNGKHIRNFVFVHPQDGSGGYWLLFDEVDATTANVNAQVALHPNSDLTPVTASVYEEYTFTVSPYQASTNSVELTAFLATPPDTVQIRNGGFGGIQPENWVGKYLYSTYATDGSGKKNIVTILFPHDSTHSKAVMDRLSGSNYTGASIDLGNGIVDYAIESSGVNTITSNGASFQGLASLFRKDQDDKLVHYFVRKGTSFDYGDEGFTADANVSLYLKDMAGNIASAAGANVTFNYPGVKGAKLNGVAVPPISSGNGWIQIQVPAGSHSIELTLADESPLVYFNDFEDETLGQDPSDWIEASGEWSVADDGGNQVYEQNNIHSGAHSTLDVNGSDLIYRGRFKVNNLNAYSGIWFAVRWNDENNYVLACYYYEQWMIRERVNGTITTLASAPAALVTGQWYEVKVTAIGSDIALEVDGTQVVKTTAATKTSPGRIGLYSHKVDSYFDDIQVNGIFFSDDFEGVSDGQDPIDWAEQSGNWEVESDNGNHVYWHSGNSTLGAHTVVQAAGSDNKASVSLEGKFKVNSQTHTPSIWFAIRWNDNNNHVQAGYYNGNWVIREKVSGTLNTLASIPVTLNLNQWYEMKVTANGSDVALEVNGVQVAATTSVTKMTPGQIALYSHYSDTYFDDIIASDS